MNKREWEKPQTLSVASFISERCVFWHFSQSVGAVNLHIMLPEAVFLFDFPFLLVLLGKSIHVIFIWNPVAFNCTGT